MNFNRRTPTFFPSTNSKTLSSTNPPASPRLGPYPRSPSVNLPFLLKLAPVPAHFPATIIQLFNLLSGFLFFTAAIAMCVNPLPLPLPY